MANPLIFLLAPAANMTFASLPSGSTYLSDENGLIVITNGSVADENALVAAGCLVLNTLISSYPFGYSSLLALYSADTASQGTAYPYPVGLTVEVYNDPTSSNDGVWTKTGSGYGSGNWTQQSNLTMAQLSSLITTLTTNLNAEISRAENAEAINADNIILETSRAKAAETANAAAIAAETTRAETEENYLQSEITSLQATWAALHLPAGGQAQAATTTALPNSPAYSNGASGVGATLTAGANAAFPTIDGVAAALNNRYVIAGQAIALQNGIYVLTQLGSGSAPWILTRATDANTAAELGGIDCFVAGGTTYQGYQFILPLQASAITIGATALAFWALAPVSPPGSVAAVAVSSIAALRSFPASAGNIGGVFYSQGAWAAGDGGAGHFLCTGTNPGAHDTLGFTASISGTTLTVTALGAANSKIHLGHVLTGTGVASGTVVTGYGSAYSSAVFNGTVLSGTLTVSSVLSGTIYVGQTLYGANVGSNVTITGGSGSTWTLSNGSLTISTSQIFSSNNPTAIGSYTVNNSQTVSSSSLTATHSGENGGTWIASATPSFWFVRIMGDEPIQARWFGATAKWNYTFGYTNPVDPLSNHFSTLAAAQAVYPHAVALTDETDWAALQAAADFVHQRAVGIGGSASSDQRSFATGTIALDGRFAVNRTVSLNAATIKVKGTSIGYQGPFGNGTSIQYNGPPGTLTSPAFIFDFWAYDELGNDPPGKHILLSGSGGLRAVCEGISFSGQSGSMTAAYSATPALNPAAFVSGVRIRAGLFVHVSDCTFADTLWDGLVFSGAQLFCIWERNWFYGCYRDCVHVASPYNNFSTTIWEKNNEYGYYGRYAILCDVWGSVQAKCTFSESDVEGMFNSWFVQNPQWFVHGVPSSFCVMGGTNTKIDTCRIETNFYGPNYFADVHLANCAETTIDGLTGNGLFVSNNTNSAAPRTAALIDYQDAIGTGDITDQQNYNVGSPTDNVSTPFNLHLKDWTTGSAFIYLSDGAQTSPFTSYQNIVENVQLSYVTPLVIPTSNAGGSYAARYVQPRTTAVPSATYLPNTVFRSCIGVQDTLLGVYEPSYFDTAIQSGNIKLQSGSYAFSKWQASHTYQANLPTLGTFSPPNFIVPTTDNGYYYQCTTGGTSGTTQPTWPTTIGATVNDGTVTWTCVAQVAMSQDVGGGAGVSCSYFNGRQWRTANSYPTAGFHNAGDFVENANPTIQGTSGSQYIVGGWRRLTTNGNNTLNTDWVAERTLTGT